MPSLFMFTHVYGMSRSLLEYINLNYLFIWQVQSYAQLANAIGFVVKNIQASELRPFVSTTENSHFVWPQLGPRRTETEDFVASLQKKL